MLQKFVLLITPEDNKQQNQAGHSFHWQPSQNFSTDLSQSTDLRW